MALVKHHDQNQPGQDSGRECFVCLFGCFVLLFRFFLAFNLQVTLHHWGRSGQEIEVGTCKEEGTEAMRHAPYWLGPHGLLSELSYTIQDHKQGWELHHSQWARPSHINHWSSKWPPAFLQASLIERLSQICLGLCLVDKNQWTCGTVVWNSSMYSPKRLMVSVRFPG